MGRACSSKRKSRKGSTCRERPIDPQLLETEMLRREEEDIQDQIEAEQAHIDAHQARLETFQIRLEDIQARLAPDGVTHEIEEPIPRIDSSYEVEVFHPEVPSARRLVNTELGSEDQERFFCFRDCYSAWGNVTSDEDILRMSGYLREGTECTGIYIRMDLINDERFEAAKESCTAVRVTYNDDRAPDGKLVTKPEYLAPGDPLPVLFSNADANAG
ncbi:Ff.00g077640.m01.CDS01 [Fusarium sp. VM40]|nr:Ff.00g077640.m01.CDS01 [Fusarium sp. VM40]